MKAVILAGGKGKRLAPFTVTIPKPLVPVGEKAILEIIVNQLREANIKKLKFAVGYLAELIEAYFGDGSKFGVSIEYSREDKPLGTAGPVRLLVGEKEDFLVMNGDVLADMKFEEFLNFHKRSGSIATICCYEKTSRSSLGIVETDNNGFLKDYREKPVTTNLVSTGIYCFKPPVAEHIKEGECIDLPDLMRRLIDSGEKIGVYLMKDEWFDIGTFEDHAKAQEYWVNKSK